MKLADLRNCVDNEELVRITIHANNGHDGSETTVKSGDNLFFTVDSSIDGFDVTHIAAEKGDKGKSAELQYDVANAVLRIDLSCDMQDIENLDWKSVFNNPVMIESGDFSGATIGME